MADIDPYAQLAATALTPRSPNIVDAIAETARIAEAQMRANPLYNARIDSGLMVWRGNYAGAGGIQDSLLWIGEFAPNDATLGKPQRGFALTRDDPGHGWALYMYDPGAESRGPGNPLRQRIFMRDADSKPILSEAEKGGVKFPVGQIPLYGTAVNYMNVRIDSGTGMVIAPILPSYVVQGGSIRTYYEGYGAMTGHRIRFYGFGNSTGTGVFQMRIRCSFGDGAADYVSPFISCPAGGGATFLWDVDFAGQDKVGRIVNVRFEGQVTAGSDQWNLAFPAQCYSYGD